MATNDSIDSANIPPPLSHGGTGAQLTASNGGILYSDATKAQILASTSTANQPLLSGASGAPGWSTATYPGSTTINRILYSSANNVVGQITSANSSFLATDVSGVPSMITAAAALIQMGAVGAIKSQVFSTPGAGTYTPSSGMIACLIIAVGGGGGGGGVSAAAASNSFAGGGGAGGTAIKIFTAAAIGASKAFSIGAGGAGGTAGANDGSSGANTTFNTTSLTASGGSGGKGGATTATTTTFLGGTGGTASSGDINFSGNPGNVGFSVGLVGTGQFLGGGGGSSFFGGGAIFSQGSGAGNSAAQYGAGGGGAFDGAGVARAGGAGSGGVIYVIEWCNQ